MKTVDGVVCMQCDNDSNILQETIKVYYLLQGIQCRVKPHNAVCTLHKNLAVKTPFKKKELKEES